MQTHPTYSLNTLLSNQHLQPQLYDTLLHQIKSPLQEFSVDITNDQSLTEQHPHPPPKRPNIPPPPSHLYHQPSRQHTPINEVDFSRTYQSILYVSEPVKLPKDEKMEAAVSPLDQEINVKQEEKKAWWFCGKESDLKDDKYEIQVEDVIPKKNSKQKQEKKVQFVSPVKDEIIERVDPSGIENKPKKRRPIFEDLTLMAMKKMGMLPEKKGFKSFKQACSNLQNRGSYDLALFFQLLGHLQEHLSELKVRKMEVQNHLEPIYQKLSYETTYSPELREKTDLARIMTRLRSKNTCEALAKILKRRPQKTYQQAESSLNAIFESLDYLEQQIASFMRKEDALLVLERVHSHLSEYFASSSTFLQQLVCLCGREGVRLLSEGFQLIWQEGCSRKLTCEQFMEGLAMNDLIVRGGHKFEQQMELKGFSRNS